MRRCEILLSMGFVAGWSREIRAMNEGKEGARFRYPESTQEKTSGSWLRAA